MDRNKVVLVTNQGGGTTEKGESDAIFIMTDINEFMIT